MELKDGEQYHGNMTCGNVYVVLASTKDLVLLWAEAIEEPNSWFDEAGEMRVIPNFIRFHRADHTDFWDSDA